MNLANGNCASVGTTGAGGNLYKIRCWRDGSWATGNYSLNRWFLVSLGDGREGYVHSSLVGGQYATPNCSELPYVRAADWAIACIGQVTQDGFAGNPTPGETGRATARPSLRRLPRRRRLPGRQRHRPVLALQEPGPAHPCEGNAARAHPRSNSVHERGHKRSDDGVDARGILTAAFGGVSDTRAVGTATDVCYTVVHGHLCAHDAWGVPGRTR